MEENMTLEYSKIPKPIYSYNATMTSPSSHDYEATKPNIRKDDHIRSKMQSTSFTGSSVTESLRQSLQQRCKASQITRMNIVEDERDDECGPNADTFRWYQEEITRCVDDGVVEQDAKVVRNNRNNDTNVSQFNLKDLTYVHDPISEEELQYVPPQQKLASCFDEVLSQIPQDYIKSYLFSSVNSSNQKSVHQDNNPGESLGTPKKGTEEFSNLIFDPPTVTLPPHAVKDKTNGADLTEDVSDLELEQLEQDCIGRNTSPVHHQREQVRGGGPIYNPMAEEEFLTKSIYSDPAQKTCSKRTKTIFSVVQKMRCSDQLDQVNNNDRVDVDDDYKIRSNNQEPLKSSNEETCNNQKTINQVKDTKEEIHEQICTRESYTNAPVHDQVDVARDTLVFQQLNLPSSKAFSAAIRLENNMKFFLGYKVFCNYKGAIFCYVTPSKGIIPPKSGIILTVKMKKDYMSSKMMKSVKFMVKMFPKSESVRNLNVYLNNLSEVNPELICTHILDNIIICSPDDLQGMNEVQDGIENVENGVFGKEKLLGQYSTLAFHGNAKPTLRNIKMNALQTEALVGNQKIRTCNLLLQNLKDVQKWITWTSACVLLCVLVLCIQKSIVLIS